VTPLAPSVEATLRQAPLSYPRGHSAAAPPPGYGAITRTRALATQDFAAASEALLSWQVQLRAGIRVAASSDRVGEGCVALMRIGLGPLAVAAPCRVVYVVDEPARQGFAYGTLPGHPESGEESFILQRADDGRLVFTVSAFSRPATALTKLGGPLGRGVQRAMANRYLRALDRS
jgi:uncharacterized protein (UPF0548 family)